MAKSYKLKEGTIEYPKKPDHDIMQKLIWANQFLEHAKSHLQQKTDFDMMIAAHNLDNAVEYLLRILIDSFSVETVAYNLDSCEMSNLYGELNKFFSDNGIETMPYRDQILRLRKQRNLVQHGAMNPGECVEKNVRYVENFFDMCLKNYFGISRSEIRYSSLVNDDHQRECLRMAEENLEERDYLHAMLNLRDAFEHALFMSEEYYIDSTWKNQAMEDAKKISFEYYNYLSDMNDIMRMIIRNINISDYQRFKLYLYRIPPEYYKGMSFNCVTNESWELQDVEFCYEFVSNEIIQLQSTKKNVVQINDYTFEDLREGDEFAIKIGVEGIDCTTLFPERQKCYKSITKEAYTFYVRSYTDVEFIQKRSEDISLIKYGIKGDEKIELVKERVSIQAMNTRLVMNNPETWEVYIEITQVQK